MNSDFPSYNKLEDYIDKLSNYANLYYSQVKRVREALTSADNENTIRNNIRVIGRHIFNTGGEDALCECILLLILSNNLIFNANYSTELFQLHQQQVNQVTEYWTGIETDAES